LIFGRHSPDAGTPLPEEEDYMTRKGFTLIELLVVIAIIAILAAILFPVFAQAKMAAKKAAEISYFNQVGKATAMYTGDNDGRFFLSNSGGNPIGWGFGPPDTVPAQQMAPYMKNWDVHRELMDSWDNNRRIADECLYMGCNINTATQTQKDYALGVRSNMGYNYAFFSPWRYYQPVNYNPSSASVSESEVQNVSGTLLFVDSIWDRDSSGNPTGGGNWVIETPCWKDANNQFLRPMSQYAPGTGDGSLYSYGTGWVVNSWLVYGGTWPFWNQTNLSNLSPGLKDGMVVTEMADTSTKSRPVKRLTDGCSAYGAGAYRGQVIDSEKFIWDLD
jgi:prepilin-type N-terminal cleavage/methylation domain-containing protein